MSIYVYTGTPGSGKSFSASKVILEELSKNKYVVSNYNLNSDYYIKHVNSNIKKRAKNGYGHSKKYKNAKHELYFKFLYIDNHNLCPYYLYELKDNFFEPDEMEQALLVIDEASMLYDNRRWSQFDREDWVDFFKLHRKIGFDVILIEQNKKSIDGKILHEVEYEFHHRCITKFGKVGKVLKTLGIQAFAQIHIWQPLTIKEKQGHRMFIYQRFYNALYNTFEIFGFGKDGNPFMHPDEIVLERMKEKAKREKEFAKYNIKTDKAV